MLLVMFLFMALPTLNLVNINLSRILERSSEIGVRKAFGASSRTLVGQFVMENVILTLVGGALALVLSWITLTARSGIAPGLAGDPTHRPARRSVAGCGCSDSEWPLLLNSANWRAPIYVRLGS